MIIEAILDVVFTIIKLVFSWLNLPDAPEGVESMITGIAYYISCGISFIRMFVPIDLFVTLFGIYLLVLNAGKIYDLAWWIIQKIPMLNIRKE